MKVYGFREKKNIQSSAEWKFGWSTARPYPMRILRVFSNFKLAPTIPLKKHLKFSLGSMVNNAKENTYKHIKPLCIEHDFFFGLNQR
jgi:hypothetical protein